MLYRDLPDNLFFAPGTWSLKRCETGSCGMVWLDPMPSSDDLSLAYKNYYTHGDERKRSLGFRLFRAIYRGLVDAVLMLGCIPLERRRAAAMFTDGLSSGKLLDIGCGQGFFLGMMAKRGWSVMGVDFDSLAVEAARRAYSIDVRVGTVDTMLETGIRFDVVTASHVIEHVPHPKEFLVKCRLLLRPGGRMILRTPNVDSIGHRQYGKYWRGLEPPRHLHLFTVQALESMSLSAGFVRSDCFTSSVAAEGMLTASYIIKKKGQYPAHNATLPERLVFKILPPIFGLRAKFYWKLDPSSGEEICAVLTNAMPASGE